MMKRNIFIFLFLIILFSGITLNIFCDKVNYDKYILGKNQLIISNALFYSGMSLELLIGLPFSLITSFSNFDPIEPFAVITSISMISGVILELFVAPILSIYANKNIIESEYLNLEYSIETEPGLYYGISWGFTGLGLLTLGIFAITAVSTGYFKQLLKVAFIIFGICYSLSLGLRGPAVTIPIARIPL